MPETPWGDADALSSQRLRPGPGVPREVVAANQRERLFVALTVLADERGYEAIRVEDLIALAGISRGAFYEQFGSKEDCLVAAIDALVAMLLEEASLAFEGAAPDERERSTLEALLDFAAGQPAATRLWLVDAYGAGEETADRAQSGTHALQELVGQAAAGSGRAELPSELSRALLGGLWRVVAKRLRTRRAAEISGLGPPLLELLLSYEPPSTPLRRPRGGRANGDNTRIAPPDQAERILLGVCDAIAEKGYAATTLSDIAGHAATSIRTFYAHYEGKEEAYIDAIDLVQVQSQAAAQAAIRRAPDWPHAVRNGVHALCGYLAADEAVALATVVEPYAAGRKALERRDESADALARMLAPGYELAPATPSIAAEAIAGAIDTLIYDAVRAGGGANVRAVAPTATFLALAPFIGAEEATAVANDIGQPRRRRSAS